jgi:DNA repair ATPase RecN
LTTFRPTGDRIISNFSKNEETSVEVILSDNSNIKLSKEKDKTEYSIIDQKDSFSGFGLTVPKEVKEQLNISDINIQDQLTTHFLITESPGEVARRINEIIEIEKADGWISSLTSKINSENKKILMLEDECKQIKTQIDDLEYLDNLKLLANRWTEINNTKEKLEEDSQGISELISKYEKGQLIINSLSSSLKEITALLKVLSDKVISISSDREALLLIEKLLQWEYLDEYIIETKDCEELINRCYFLADEIRKKYKEIEEVNSLIISLETITDSAKVSEKNLGKIEIDIDDKISQYKDELKKLKTCPICLSKIDNDCINKIFNKMNVAYKGILI